MTSGEGVGSFLGPAFGEAVLENISGLQLLSAGMALVRAGQASACLPEPL